MQKAILVFLFFVSVCCSKPKRPDDVLTQPQLAALLIDVYLAEARTDNLRVNNMNLVKDSSIRYFLPFEEKLLKSHGLSDSTLKITYTYYLSHPKELEAVYDAIIDTLTLREKRAINAPEPKFVPKKPIKH